MEADGSYEFFTGGAGSRVREAEVHRFAGRNDRRLAIYRVLAAQPGPDQVAALGLLLSALPEVGGGAEARNIADDALSAARSSGEPLMIAYALHASDRAFVETDPQRALSAMRQALATARDTGSVSSRCCSPGTSPASKRYTATATRVSACSTLPSKPSTAPATSAASPHARLPDHVPRRRRRTLRRRDHSWRQHADAAINTVTKLPATGDHLRLALGDADFARCFGAGADMEAAEAVRYARQQIAILAGQASRASASTAHGAYRGHAGRAGVGTSRCSTRPRFWAHPGAFVDPGLSTLTESTGATFR